MHTVVETDVYLADAKSAGLTAEEMRQVVDILALDPEAGAVMPGTGGARKLRFAKAGRGKSGGYRIITYFGDRDQPVYLLTVFGKGEKDNLTKAERNTLAKETKALND